MTSAPATQDRRVSPAQPSGKALNICYVHSGVVPAQTANTVHVAKMNSAFAGHGCRVTLVCRGSPKPVAREIVRAYGLQNAFAVTRFPISRLTGGIRTFALAAVARARLLRADVIYTRDASVARMAAAGGVPTVFEAHASLEDMGPANRKALERLIGSGKLLLLVVISQALADYFLDRRPELKGRVFVAHDGADPLNGPVAPSPLARSARCAVGYVGHLYPGKGMELIAQLAQRCSWADFHVVGGAAEDVDRWRKATHAAGNLTLHGFVPHALTTPYLCGFDVVLAPYQRSVRVAGGGPADIGRWMSPLKLFEYMAAGKAIIASRLPTIQEVLEDGRTAVLCEPDEAAGWEGALRALCEDPERRLRLGTAARELFLSHYTWDRRAELILAEIGDRLKARA